MFFSTVKLGSLTWGSMGLTLFWSRSLVASQWIAV